MIDINDIHPGDLLQMVGPSAISADMKKKFPTLERFLGRVVTVAKVNKPENSVSADGTISIEGFPYATFHPSCFDRKVRDTTLEPAPDDEFASFLGI